MNGRLSVQQIPKFVRHYKINVSEIKRPLDSFRSFNDFFMRELKANARPIDSTPSNLISPCDSRLFVFDLDKQHDLPVKGYWYALIDLLKDARLGKEYADAWCFIYRLAPSDYHRFCYIDNGQQDRVRRIRGVLHSVHPIALSKTNSLMVQNYRELTILHTENFGKVVNLEVGALFVGKIILLRKNEYTFTRGEEKGWFEFGGSTIIQLFKKDTIQPDADIIEQSANRVETIVKMGEKVGVRKSELH
jgi:phosphatidylserine decarboxylase